MKPGSPTVGATPYLGGLGGSPVVPIGVSMPALRLLQHAMHLPLRDAREATGFVNAMADVIPAFTRISAQYGDCPLVVRAHDDQPLPAVLRVFNRATGDGYRALSLPTGIAPATYMTTFLITCGMLLKYPMIESPPSPIFVTEGLAIRDLRQLLAWRYALGLNFAVEVEAQWQSIRATVAERALGGECASLPETLLDMRAHYLGRLLMQGGLSAVMGSVWKTLLGPELEYWECWVANTVRYLTPSIEYQPVWSPPNLPLPQREHVISHRPVLKHPWLRRGLFVESPVGAVLDSQEHQRLDVLLATQISYDSAGSLSAEVWAAFCEAFTLVAPKLAPQLLRGATESVVISRETRGEALEASAPGELNSDVIEFVFSEAPLALRIVGEPTLGTIFADLIWCLGFVAVPAKMGDYLSDIGSRYSARSDHLVYEYRQLAALHFATALSAMLECEHESTRRGWPVRWPQLRDNDHLTVVAMLRTIGLPATIESWMGRAHPDVLATIDYYAHSLLLTLAAADGDPQ